MKFINRKISQFEYYYYLCTVILKWLDLFDFNFLIIELYEAHANKCQLNYLF